MAAIQAGGGGTGGAAGSGNDRAVITVPVADQQDGKYTLVWNLERKTRHGDYPVFSVWLADQLEPVPVVKNRDGEGKITGYTFTLSSQPAQIYII